MIPRLASFNSFLAILVLSGCATSSNVSHSPSTPTSITPRAAVATSSLSTIPPSLEPAAPSTRPESPLSPKSITTADVSELDPTRLQPVEVARKNFAQYTTLVILGSGEPGSPAYVPATLWLRADTGRRRANGLLVLWSDPGLANAQVVEVEGKDVATMGAAEARRIIDHAPEPLHFTIRKRGGARQVVEVFTSTRDPIAEISPAAPRPNHVHAP